MDRRRLLALLPAALAGRTGVAARRPSEASHSAQTVQRSAGIPYSYPIGTPGRPLGNGFFARHGYAVENTWYLPGYLHTGEDWYAITGDTAGARVYAVAVGEVVFAGSDYPGRVVIVAHADGLFAMYGHLDPELPVATGDRVARGALLGTVLRRGDDTPNHLHFEIRTFLTTPEVNGAAPRYPFQCGPDCPPGPGYWPIDAPDHPSDLGWRNPTHVIARRAFTAAIGAADRPLGEAVVASEPSAPSADVWSAPEGDEGARRTGELPLESGARYPLQEVRAGPEDSTATDANGYDLWYRLALPDGVDGWLRAAVPSSFETGSDGEPATVRFDLLAPAAAS